MSTATLSSSPVTQLTFPWASYDEDAVSVATGQPQATAVLECAPELPAESEEVAESFSDALVGERIGRPFRMGSVMFRLLKSYGITDEEIAAGVAAYHAKRAIKSAS